jgi:hypothetical protein
VFRNEKGVIALAIILSIMLVIGAVAVFGLVSGRFSSTYRLNDRAQAILDAESASYVAYMLLRNSDWAIDNASKTVGFNKPDGSVRKSVTINTSVSADGRNMIKARSRYR